LIAYANAAELVYPAALVSLIAPYVLGVRPRRPRDWRAMAMTVGFLAWLLLGLVSVRG
jgi:hypothetical protein